jgi:hypothetical protein
MGCERQSINQSNEKKEMSRKKVGTIPFNRAGGWAKKLLEARCAISLGETE